MPKIPSIVEVFTKWATYYKSTYGYGTPELISSTPEIGRNGFVYSVDVAIFVNPNKLKELFTLYDKNGIANNKADGCFTVQFNEYKRPVNVQFISNPTQFASSIQQRMNQLILAELFPPLAHEVVLLSDSVDGLPPVQAWVIVLDLDGVLCGLESSNEIMSWPIGELITAAEKTNYRPLTNT